MTQPTQAQIEAAAKVIEENRYVFNYRTIARRILIAAAQVGEQPQVQFTRTEAEYNKLKSEAEISIIALQGEISRTIERCAQVAEDMAEAHGLDIAAAIRKLKDAQSNPAHVGTDDDQRYDW